MPLIQKGQGEQCLKYSLFAFNLIFVVLGLVVIAIGVWITVDATYLSAILRTEGFDYGVAGYVLLAGGVIIFVISFIGCYGAVQEIKWMLITYFIVLAIIFLLLISAGGTAVIFRDRLTVIMKEAMNDTLVVNYGNATDRSVINKDITKAWDDAQSKLECCGVIDEGWTVYQASNWYIWNETRGHTNLHNADRRYVPASCCVVNQDTQLYYSLEHCQRSQFGPPRLPDGKNNQDVYYVGCFTVGYNLIVDNLWVIFGLGVGIGLILISGMVLSCCLCMKIRRREAKEKDGSPPAPVSKD